MIGQSVRVATVRGIEIGFHYSWIIVFVLITMSLRTQFTLDYPDWPESERYLAAVVTALLFFGSIVFHELAHSLVAVAKGIRVQSITLFVFGGVAQLAKEPERPSDEFQIAIIGPIASLALALGFAIVSDATEAWSEELSVMAGWLTQMNLVLAIFNLLPGFPLDGGRVLRAGVWWLTGNFRKAMKIAARSGQVFGYLFIFVGMLIGFHTSWFNGLWLALIGLFLLNAAQQSVLQGSLRSALAGLAAKDIMSSDCPTIPGHLSLAELIEGHVLPTGQRCFLIADSGGLEGLITLHNVKAIPRQRWPFTSVRAVMTPFDQLRVVTPDTPILEVLETLDKADVNQVPVVAANRIVGMVSRDRLLRVVHTRLELDAQAA